MSTGQRFIVSKAAVLGAGVMGAQIAAHLVNANVETLLFELPAPEGDPNGNVVRAIANLGKLEPSPLASASRLRYIGQANYQSDLGQLRSCDLVIEAISERMDLKLDLYQKVAPHLGAHTIFASNTSGLSIERLAQAMPAALRPRFCGVHFFNPPRYMYLVELIAASATDLSLLAALESFLVTTLGKGVIRARDTPNFIANRVGVFSMLATMHHAQRLGLSLEVVDALTGPIIGRAKSATFRTADVVGLDTLAHVVSTMAEALPEDPWHRYYALPQWMTALIDGGALGRKSGRGIYQKAGQEIHVYDVATASYRPQTGALDEPVAALLSGKDAGDKFAQLGASAHPQAQFVWAIFRDLFHYCAVHLTDIADNARDVDFALRWGFGWQRGPFEVWQAAGWQQIAALIARDIAAGKAMARTPLPAWVTRRSGAHAAGGSYAPAQDAEVPRSQLAVYRRQLFPDQLLGESAPQGTAIFESAAVRCWHTGDDIAIVSFKSKMHTISDEVLDGVLQAIELAQRNYAALVIWQSEPPFSAGADLTQAGKPGAVERLVAKFQHTTGQLKYSMVPTVAAVDGLALGGGCEFIMHCDRAVASLESYIGLPEAGVGLLPASGGCKEFALRAAQQARGGDQMPFLRRYFEAVAMAQVSRSAVHARELGYLRSTDRVVMNRFELLHVAKAEARLLAEAGYRPPREDRAIPVAGRSVAATIKVYAANLLEGGYISPHDFVIGSKIADTLCGGELEAGSLVDEQWLLDLERRHFMELLATEKTQQRIAHMLQTGKPLRN